MPTYSKKEMREKAQLGGFVDSTFEKVVRLVQILDFINTDEYLSKRLLLKGGTAINLLIFDLPRLSVDIDLDYALNESKDEMLESREKIRKILTDYSINEGYNLSNESRFSYSLDSFKLGYINSSNNPDFIKIDINFSLRTHILEPLHRKIIPSVFECDTEIYMVNPIEIYASKVVALLERAAPRDLFDTVSMIDAQLFKDQRDLLKKCVVFYKSISDKNSEKPFDTVEVESVSFMEVKRRLLQVISRKNRFDLKTSKEKVIHFIQSLMILTENEKEYLRLVNEKDYRPELLFEDLEIVNRLKTHPMALWKCR